MPKQLLILGGTTLARELTNALSSHPIFNTSVCLTRPTRGYERADHQLIGLLDGKQALIDVIKTKNIDGLIDATHPFALEISQTALAASRATHFPFYTLQSPAWEKQSSDQWIDIHSHEDAIQQLSQLPAMSHVFLTVGGRRIVDYVNLRSIRFTARCIRTKLKNEVDNVSLIKQKGPFSLDDERELFKRQKFDYMVTKNAGSEATYSKIVAAREFNVPVFMIQRQLYQTGMLFSEVDSLVNHLLNRFTGR